MTKKFEKIINRFDGGIESDGRSSFSNKARLIEHFDIFTDENKLIPYRDTTADESDGGAGIKDNNLKHFTLAQDGTIYAVGSASSKATMYYRANPTTGNWTEDTTHGQATTNNVISTHAGLIEWQTYWYLFTGTTSISEYQPGTGFTDAKGTVGETIKTTAPSVIGADDNLYMFYNNKVVRIDPDITITDDVCQAIPSDMRITSACRWGNYIAIGCAEGTSAGAGSKGRSQVFIWDMLTTTTVSDVIDWGEGALRVLDNIEGRLVGISDKFMEKSAGGDDLGLGQGSMVIKMWSGGVPKVMKEIVANQPVTLGRMLQDKVVKDNRLYWVASVPYSTSTATESTFHLGIWCFGRKDDSHEFALSLDYIEDSIDTSNYKINSFGNAGNYWFINHSADGSVERTSNTATYTTTSVYESLIYGDGLKKRQLRGVCVMTEKQSSGGQTVIKYKIDGATTWTTLSTNTTVGSLSHKVIPSAVIFREIEFRIESTGGTVITGLHFWGDILKSDIYG